MSTETELAAWRLGSTQAERLAAAILSIEGYELIEPQAPLGGPDDRKDILAQRGDHTVLAAVYFPGSQQSFSAIEAKYKHDRKGLGRHARDRFVFITNQNLTLHQRADIKGGNPTDEIYELQRVTTLMDSPRGYGLRLGYLRIPMTAEDQIAFFDTLESRRKEESAELSAVSGRTLNLLDDVRQTVNAAIQRPIIGPVHAPMSELRVADVVLIHRMVLGQQAQTQFRSIDVWVSDAQQKELVPVALPDQIPHMMYELCLWWRAEYERVKVSSDPSETVAFLAQFYFQFVSIHPFVDGNGRVARSLLDQAAFELTGRGVSTELTDKRIESSEAIRKASQGDFDPLERIISSALV